MKQNSEPTPWHEVYRIIAVQLQQFYKQHQSKSGLVLFKLLNSSSIYRKHNSWLVNIKRIKTPSLEPIQVFVSFSRSRQNESFRTEIINTVWERLTKNKKGWDKINFEGCPTPMALKLQYVRSETVQVRIWETFGNVMQDGKDALTPSLWDEVKLWRGIQIPSFTIFLFWIRSDEFLPLDKNTMKYLESRNLLQPKAALTFEGYENLLKNKNISDYTRLSLEAYYFINNPEGYREKFQSDQSSTNIDRLLNTFKLVGIRTLHRNKEAHKILKPMENYPLDQAIMPVIETIQNANTLQKFEFKSNNIETLYNLNDLKVNINAIVGKNGSGKSTLLDLMMMGIYNLSIQFDYLDKKENKFLKNLNFEIYWHADTLYKIVFGREILIYEFKKSKEGQTMVYLLNEIPFNAEDSKSKIFYSILVNYSHYALNSRDYEIDWIKPLSYKNDGYITPIVINPQRTEGNININREKDLLNTRLLLNLLELHDADIPQQSFRYIDNDKYLKYFSVAYDEAKYNEKVNEAKKKNYNDPNLIKWVMDMIANVFEPDKNSFSPTPYKKALEMYLVNKLFAMVDKYDRYKIKYKADLEKLKMHYAAYNIKRFNKKVEERILQLLQDIKLDNSHVTLKFKQAVYYLKFFKLRKILPHYGARLSLVRLASACTFIGRELYN